MTECYGVISENAYNVVVTVVDSNNGKKYFQLAFTEDAHAWKQTCVQAAESVARLSGLAITSWREY